MIYFSKFKNKLFYIYFIVNYFQINNTINDGTIEIQFNKKPKK